MGCYWQSWDSIEDTLTFSLQNFNVDIYEVLDQPPAMALVCNSSSVGQVPDDCGLLTNSSTCSVAIFADDFNPPQTTAATALLISQLMPDAFTATGEWQPQNFFTVLQGAQSLKVLDASSAGLSTVLAWTSTPQLLALRLDGNMLTDLPLNFSLGLAQLRTLYVTSRIHLQYSSSPKENGYPIHHPRVIFQF